MNVGWTFGLTGIPKCVMLFVLECPGCVKGLPEDTMCGGGSTQCQPESTEIYEWMS